MFVHNACESINITGKIAQKMTAMVISEIATSVPWGRQSGRLHHVSYCIFYPFNTKFLKMNFHNACYNLFTVI